jgi:hypothetical protein
MYSRNNLISVTEEVEEHSVMQTPARVYGDLWSWAAAMVYPVDDWDHTWVTDYGSLTTSRRKAAKDYWYCGGKYHGSAHAAQLRRARADLRFARCIAAPNLRGCWRGNPALGGIYYGVTGVCHQIANRVLFATSFHPDGHHQPITVCGARNYLATLIGFDGPYGSTIAEWEERVAHCMIMADIAVTRDEENRPVLPGGPMDNLESVVKDRLGDEYDADKAVDISIMQRAFARDRELLIQQIETRALTARQYAREFNALLTKYLVQIESILGPENYRRAFDGVPPDAPVVDPDTVERYWGNEK